MTVQLVYRKAHTRRLSSGETTFVAGAWIMRELSTRSNHSKRHLHDCPVCGALVRSVKMPNGGWVHFEGAGGLQSMEHPCFYIGEGMLHRKDPNTLDMFDRL